jgi:shikimate kinase
MYTDIILIGPISVGKTTIGKLLSKQLNLPQVSMDELRISYYNEIGYDENIAQQKREEGWWSRYWYWKRFEAYAVERILAEHNNCVIDFGAGHSVYEDSNLFERVQNILAPYNYVVLLLPDPDMDKSLKILNSRDEITAQLADVNEHFLRHHSNYDLAKWIVYTKNKTPPEICNEIIKLVNDNSTNDKHN